MLVTNIFSFSHNIFNPFIEKKHHFSSSLIFSSAKAFNLDQDEILSFDKELRISYLSKHRYFYSSGIAGGQMGGFFQGGQCFSPPTRQRRDSFNDSPEDINRHTSRFVFDH